MTVCDWSQAAAVVNPDHAWLISAAHVIVWEVACVRTLTAVIVNLQMSNIRCF